MEEVSCSESESFIDALLTDLGREQQTTAGDEQYLGQTELLSPKALALYLRRMSEFPCGNDSCVAILV